MTLGCRAKTQAYQSLDEWKAQLASEFWQRKGDKRKRDIRHTPCTAKIDLMDEVGLGVVTGGYVC